MYNMELRDRIAYTIGWHEVDLGATTAKIERAHLTLLR